MKRRRLTPAHIDPQAVYTVQAAKQIIGMADITIRAAIRTKQLTAKQLGKTYYILGAHLQLWLTDHCTVNVFNASTIRQTTIGSSVIPKAPT